MCEWHFEIKANRLTNWLIDWLIDWLVTIYCDCSNGRRPRQCADVSERKRGHGASRRGTPSLACCVQAASTACSAPCSVTSSPTSTTVPATTTENSVRWCAPCGGASARSSRVSSSSSSSLSYCSLHMTPQTGTPSQRFPAATLLCDQTFHRSFTNSECV